MWFINLEHTAQMTVTIFICPQTKQIKIKDITLLIDWNWPIVADKLYVILLTYNI